jgi:hypothetical protein
MEEVEGIEPVLTHLVTTVMVSLPPVHPARLQW